MNGGTAGLIWGNIIVAVGMAFVYASIAELASMLVHPIFPSFILENSANRSFCRAPTSAGQYHWVSEFSPRFCQKYLSYICGPFLPSIVSFPTFLN